MIFDTIEMFERKVGGDGWKHSATNAGELDKMVGTLAHMVLTMDDPASTAFLGEWRYRLTVKRFDLIDKQCQMIRFRRWYGTLGPIYLILYKLQDELVLA